MGIKISQLPSTTTYDGTELIAIVQNGVTRKGSLKSLVPILSVGISLKDVTELKALSGNWQKAYTTSTAYQAASATFASSSLVQSTSALLLTRSDYSTSSATFAPITIVSSSSANWNSTYAIVSALSSSYGPTGLSGSVLFSTGNILTADSGLMYTGMGGSGALRVGGSLKLGTTALNTSIVQTAMGTSKTVTLPNATGTVPVYVGTPAIGNVLISVGTNGISQWGPAPPLPAQAWFLTTPEPISQNAIAIQIQPNGTTAIEGQPLSAAETISITFNSLIVGTSVTFALQLSSGTVFNSTTIAASLAAGLTDAIRVPSLSQYNEVFSYGSFISVNQGASNFDNLASNTLSSNFGTTALPANRTNSVIQFCNYIPDGLGQLIFDYSQGIRQWVCTSVNPIVWTDLTALSNYNLPPVGRTIASTDTNVAQTFTGPLESTNSVVKLTNLPIFSTNAAASGLDTGAIYKTSTGELRIKF